MIILGIETSCDETALALIETRSTGETFECRVISSLINSQADLHSPYGGVFPTLAKREHEKNLVPLLEKTLEQFEVFLSAHSSEFVAHKDAYCTSADHSVLIEQFRSEFAAQNADLFEAVAHAPFLAEKPLIDLIAVTEGPGLEPALWTGIVFAQMLSRIWNIPVIPINHMEGHVVGSLLQPDVPYGTWQTLKPLAIPTLALLISGGHTELVKVTEQLSPSKTPRFSYSIIGQTKDDAVGEAFDKVARLLDLPYPGGPHVSKLAAEAREQKIQSEVKLPRPMIASKDLAFSFSGLKTAVLYAVREAEKSGPLSDTFKQSLAREFEESITETIDAKLRKALEETGAQSIIIGGGVSANLFLREALQKTTTEYGVELHLPSSHISGDNALMIALAGAFAGIVPSNDIRANGTKRLGG